MPRKPQSLARRLNPTKILCSIKTPELNELLAGIFMAAGTIKQDERPIWATNAAKEFVGCVMNGGNRQERKSENFRLGYMSSFLKTVRPTELGCEEAVVSEIVNSGIDVKVAETIGKEPPKDAADYFSGLATGLRDGEPTISGPVGLYAFVAIGWRGIAKLKNMREFHALLTQKCGANLTGSRDRVTKFARKIGLRFVDKGGRPRTKPRKALKK